MNILFLTMADYESIYIHGLYSDLLRQFIKHGDNVYMISAFENFSQKEKVIEEKNARIIKIPIMTMQKTNTLKKGLSMLTVNGAFRKGIKKYLGDVKIDLVLYPTPPITLLNSVKYIKKRDNAISYLLLKDIFPQNAVDLGMMKKNGINGLVYRYFRRKEIELYKKSDYIGCMSEANVHYILQHNTFIKQHKIEVCPNCVDIVDMSINEDVKILLRKQYSIPIDKKVFVFGGNLGKPQGIPFFIECLKASKNISEAFFLIIGDGTEYLKIQKYIEESMQENVRLMKHIPREDYDRLVGACDIGLIFLDHRFTIPNFPSRLLSYMQAKVPVLAVTDPNTDIGKVVVGGGFGWWCESNNCSIFVDLIKKIINSNLTVLRDNEYQFLKDHYSVDFAYKTIINHIR